MAIYWRFVVELTRFPLKVENQTAICCVIQRSQAQKCKIVIPALDSKHALQNTITVSWNIET